MNHWDLSDHSEINPGSDILSNGFSHVSTTLLSGNDSGSCVLISSPSTLLIWSPQTCLFRDPFGWWKPHHRHRRLFCKFVSTDVVLCNSSQTLPASIASSCQVCCPVMIVVLVCLSHRHRPTTATYHRHTYYSGTPPWTIEICPTILRLTQGRTFSAMMVSHTCQPVKCPVPWGHLSLLSCTTLLGWGLNVWGYQ